MNRPWTLGGAFGACLVVVLVAMGWITGIALQLEQSEQATRRQAELEERVRLALWRMESALAPLIAEESGRPYFAYSPFYAPERAYTSMFSEVRAGEILVPSPLLGATPPHVLLHFQVDPDGQITSPQVPEGNMRDLAEAGYVTRERITAAEARLSTLKTMLDAPALRQRLPGPTSQPDAWTGSDAVVAGEPPQNVEPAGLQSPAQQQQLRNVVEQNARFQQQTGNLLNGVPAELLSAADVSGGVLKAFWHRNYLQGDALLLARRISVRGSEYIQGCWLDGPEIWKWLRREAKDLLPELDLRPWELNASDPRQLAALPLYLIPGDLPASSEAGVSALRVTLVVAWACVLLAAMAVAVLLTGTVSLSERRAAFVSAVTHEMRTPLTTFRLYTDMLLKDMVPSEEKRRRYLTTLRTEAHRLGHLVENVLAYARLEQSRDRRPLETVSLQELVARAQDRLAARADQAGMELTVEADASAAAHRVRVDVSAVEQILFNLVDNACKYAGTASERRIHVQIDCRAGQAAIDVRDHGPGISKKDARRLFRPFSKSAHDAANSSPGVGLGLALSRRLARSMGGDLRLNERYAGGAGFVLTLPVP
jgi:signal transduction histidine kinase